MRIPEKLLSTFTKNGGGRFRGFLTTPAPAATNGTLSVRTMHIPRPCNVVGLGDVILDGQGNKLLLMDSPQGLVNTKSFRVVVVSQEYQWQRNEKTQDPVSGMERDLGLQDMGVVYAYFEHPTDTTLYGLKETKYRFYTGQDVQEGDIVGGKRVKQVSRILGVNLVIAE